MYDYKFRQSDLSFGKRKRKRKRAWHNALFLTAGLALAAGALYGIVHLGFLQQGNSEATNTDSNTIRLPLPPHTEPKGD